MSKFSEFKVTPVELMGDLVSDSHEIQLLQDMLKEATEFVSRFKWCAGIKGAYFGLGVGGVVAVFLFEINNKAQPRQDVLWVVVGDIPPAYLVGRDGPEDPEDALRTYVELMNEWVDAVREGRPTENLIPVNVPPTLEWADKLSGRLDDLAQYFLG